MRDYFINPEIKLSSIIIGVLTIVFLSVVILVQQYNYHQFKKSYIGSMGALGLRVIEKNPQLEKDIIPIITKEASKDDLVKGEVFLKQYGLSESTENVFFPYVNESSVSLNWQMFIIFIALGIVFLCLNFFQLSYFYKKLSKLTKAAERVIEGDYETSISEYKEGHFSKLSSSFNSMREIIRNNISELNKEKQFLADTLSDISHQLKTPLSSMILYNDIMLSKDLNKEQRYNFLESSRHQLDKMNWLIKQLLRLAKLDAKAIELNKEIENLCETVLDSLEGFMDRARDENIGIGFKEVADIYFLQDKLWLQEAFSNIIKNAIEHTAPGKKVSISLEENPVYIRAIIEDEGEGISEEDLPFIFKRFYKARNSRKTDSIGIGLALAKSIIEAHNGIIEVSSKIGEGTRFMVTFLKY